MKKCKFTDHDNGNITFLVRHVTGTCIKCGADLDEEYRKYKENEECLYCHHKGTQARSPTGDWCNYCGYSEPGYDCKRCGREWINPDNHLNLKTGERCLSEK